MPSEAVVSKEESRRAQRADGETRPKAKTEAQKHGRHKEERQGKEEERRRKDLERERREAEVSTRKQAEAVKKAAEELRNAVRAKTPKTPEAAAGARQKAEEPPLVQSQKPLEFLPRDQVTEAFESQGVNLAVPADWDRWSHVKRRIWLEKKQVLETLQFPESDVLYRDDEDKTAV